MLVRSLRSPEGDTVEIYLESPERSGEDWFTAWSIVGLEEGEISMETGGIDPLQSLILTLASVGDRVKSSRKKLSFIGGSTDQLITCDMIRNLWHGE